MAGSIRRIVLNPRAYIRPFVFILVVHHLPLLIAYGWIDRPKGYEQCRPLYDLFDWIRGAFISHLIMVSFVIMSLTITLCSNVYRTTKSEHWIILLLFLLYLCNLIWAIYGEAATPGDTSVCFHNSKAYQDAADSVGYFQDVDLIVSAIVLALVTSSSYLCGVHTNVNLEQAEQRWQSRCVRMARFFTCTSLHRTLSPDLLESLGKMLCKFFVVRYKSDVYEGFQFNDLLFCLGLVSKAQEAEREAIASSVEPIRFLEEEEATRLQDLAFYGRLAAGMYGWPMYVWYSPLKSFRIFRRTPSKEMVLEHDNAINANCASFLAHTGLPSTSLIYLNCYNTLFMSPYSIVRDSERQELIISVRGSLSFYDYVTDGMAHTDRMEPEELPGDVPNPQATVAHYGMLRTARSIYQHLQMDTRKELFWDFALSHCETTFNGHRAERAWKVVVCGHSLGAGVSAVLAVLLKRTFPQTTAALYAPPMMFDPITAAWTRSFMTTVVYGDDIVPRLSIGTMMQLREEMMTSFNAVATQKLYRVRYAKYLRQKKQKVETKVETPTVAADARAFSVANSVVDVDVESNGPNYTDLAMDFTFEEDDSSQTESQELVDIDFVRTTSVHDTVQVDLPGLIVHIQSVHRPRTCGCTILLGSQPLDYCLRDASYFRRIWVTPRTIQDHMVHHYDRDIRQLLHCLDIPLERTRLHEIHVDISEKVVEGYHHLHTPRGRI